MDNAALIICLCAIATYATRIAGHLIISRFGAIHHRAEAALEMVPTAVLTALVAPALLTHGLAEALAIILAGIIALRASLMINVAAGMVAVILLRHLLY